MRNMLVLSAAASVLSLGIGAHQVGALSPGSDAIVPEGLVHKVQKGDDKGAGARGQDDGGKGTSPGARDGGGKGPGPGAAQDKGGDRRAAPDKGDRGAQTREKGTRGQQRTGDVEKRGDKGRADRRTDIDVDVRGRRGDRDRTDRRTRVDIDVDRERRARGRDRDVDIDVRGYGYRSGNCQDILRRYRQCMAR